MDVTVEVVPATPRASVNGGYFSVIVRVRNTTSALGFLPLPVLKSVGFPVSFAYQLHGSDGESAVVFALDKSAATFAPGETKLHIFDFFIGNATLPGEVSTGLYSVTGAYGGKNAPGRSFTVE